MKLRSIAWMPLSIAVAVVLIVALIRMARIDPHSMLRQLANVNRAAFLQLTILMAVHIFLSAQKWRLMDGVLRRAGDIPLSRIAFFAFTSLGVAMGQVLPAMSMVIARVLGTQLHGRAVTRGTAAALADQGSDFLIVCFLIPASVLTRVFERGTGTWLVLATGMAMVTLVTADYTLDLARRFAFRFGKHGADAKRWQRGVADLVQSGLFEAGLVRKLLVLSMLRFTVLVLMAGETSQAIRINVPLWHLAAAMPFAVIAQAIGVTPGGIGLNELTFTTGLAAFGTPLAVSAEWALANRVLTAAAAFAVAACTVVGLLLWKLWNPVGRNDGLDIVSERMDRATNDA